MSGGLTTMTAKGCKALIRAVRRRGVLGAVLVALAQIGCGRDGNGPPTPTTPTAPVTSREQLEGSWAGWYSAGKAANACWGVVWSPQLGGPGVTGPGAFGGFGDPMPNPFNATITGSLTGANLTMAIDSTPPGATPAPCNFIGSGTVQAGQSTISGPLSVTFAPQCSFSGTFTGTLMLTKGGKVPNFCP